jgi:hypothetical protein
VFKIEALLSVLINDIQEHKKHVINVAELQMATNTHQLMQTAFCNEPSMNFGVIQLFLRV